jgi:hypothetical protein
MHTCTQACKPSLPISAVCCCPLLTHLFLLVPSASSFLLLCSQL